MINKNRHVNSLRNMQSTMTYPCKNWQDGRKVGAFWDEVESDKVLHDALIVAVYQMTDGFNHAILDVVIHPGHEPKVEDCQTAVWRSNQVSGMLQSTRSQISDGSCITNTSDIWIFDNTTVTLTVYMRLFIGLIC